MNPNISWIVGLIERTLLLCSIKVVISQSRLSISITGEYTLDFPNDEVRKGFISLTANSYFKTEDELHDNWVKNLDKMPLRYNYRK